jgi:hypothetical protein
MTVFRQGLWTARMPHNAPARSAGQPPGKPSSKGIRLLWWQPACDLAHDRNDLLHDITAYAAGSASQQNPTAARSTGQMREVCDRLSVPVVHAGLVRYDFIKAWITPMASVRIRIRDGSSHGKPQPEKWAKASELETGPAHENRAESALTPDITHVVF